MEGELIVTFYIAFSIFACNHNNKYTWYSSTKNSQKGEKKNSLTLYYCEYLKFLLGSSMLLWYLKNTTFRWFSTQNVLTTLWTRIGCLEYFVLIWKKKIAYEHLGGVTHIRLFFFVLCIIVMIANKRASLLVLKDARAIFNQHLPVCEPFGNMHVKKKNVPLR